MRNFKDLMAALKYAAHNRQGFSVGGADFSPEQTREMLGEIYDLLAVPVVAEYQRRYGGGDLG